MYRPSSLSSLDSTATQCSTSSFSNPAQSRSSSRRSSSSGGGGSGNTTGQQAVLHSIAAAAAAAAAATAAATDALPHTVPHATTGTTTATTATHRHPDHRVDSSRSHTPHHGPHESATVLGIDFGGTGIKGAPVDVVHGVLLHERVRIPTPAPATPAAVAGVIRQLQQHFQWDGPIGMGMPSVVRRGVVRSAANIDKTWIDVRAQEMFEAVTGCPVAVLNDADAAGHAEMRFGAGREFAHDGVVLMLTFGTGIGTALFVNGMLVPNLEMGHIEVDGEIAEKVASGAVREREDMSWKKWASRVNEYIERMEHYLQPDMIIVGGGVSKKDDKFMHLLHAPAGARVVRAEMRNEAGIVGAALGGASILDARWQAQERARVNPTLLN